MSVPVIALDIGPLSERNHTGIANVTKHLATAMLGDKSIEALFTLNRSVIPREIVQSLVKLTQGDILWWMLGRATFPGLDAAILDKFSIGIYPGHKWHRRLFPVEVQIVHDLTTVVVPQFHTEESVKFWNERLLGDMATSDLIVPVSQSTLTDIHTYYPELRKIPAIVSHLGTPAVANMRKGKELPPEPYVVVLGTLEPRKNIEFVLEYLAENPTLAEKLTFLFVGRFGWGSGFEELIDKHQLRALLQKRRIRFTGFVSDAVKDALIGQAQAIVYPSRYEGFGLPVLEALSFGVPVITTTSSSLPEVGGDLVYYCDPDDHLSFGKAIAKALSDGTSAEHAAARRGWCASFTWQKTYLRIKDAAIALRKE